MTNLNTSQAHVAGTRRRHPSTSLDLWLGHRSRSVGYTTYRSLKEPQTVGPTWYNAGLGPGLGHFDLASKSPGPTGPTEAHKGPDLTPQAGRFSNPSPLAPFNGTARGSLINKCPPGPSQKRAKIQPEPPLDVIEGRTHLRQSSPHNPRPPPLPETARMASVDRELHDVLHLSNGLLAGTCHLANVLQTGPRLIGFTPPPSPPPSINRKLGA